MNVARCTIGFFLIAGILSTTIAQDQAWSLRESSRGSLDSGGAHHDIMGGLNPKFEEMLRPRCEKNGGPKAYDNFVRSREDLVKCVSSVVETLKAEDPVPVTMDGVLKKVCSKIPDFKHCIQSTTGPMTACLDSKDRNNSRIVNNVMNALLDFLCADNGRHIKDMFADTTIVCFVTKAKAGEKCAHQHLAEISNHKSRNTAASVFGIEECTMYQKVQHCYVQAFKECEEQTTANLANSLFNTVIQQTPCKDLLKSSSARIDLLSTTVLMGIVMSIRFV